MGNEDKPNDALLRLKGLKVTALADGINVHLSLSFGLERVFSLPKNILGGSVDLLIKRESRYFLFLAHFPGSTYHLGEHMTLQNSFYGQPCNCSKTQFLYLQSGAEIATAC